MKRLEANTAEKNPGQKVEATPLSTLCVRWHLNFSPRRGEKSGKWWFNAMRWWRMKEARGRRELQLLWILKTVEKSLFSDWPGEFEGGLPTASCPCYDLHHCSAVHCISGSVSEKGIALHCIGWLSPALAKMHCKPIACIPFTPRAQKTPFSDECSQFTAVLQCIVLIAVL